MSFPGLIECGNHQFAPSAATCVHVIQRTATDVVPVRCEEGGEDEYDWLCPQCFKKYFLHNENTFDVDDLVIVCIHYLRKALKPYRKQMQRRLKNSLARRKKA